MIEIKDNKRIGLYLQNLIKESKYRKVRQFCIAYLKLANQEPTIENITNMQNRMSQIINGKKSIQVYDLPLFCELLNVSCEQIITAGKHYAPVSGHITNYEIAFSKDKELWDKYIKHADTPFLNSDEYGKTVLDYAFEFRNYEFLKYLTDNKYIWFAKGDTEKSFGREFGFGAGTSIKPDRHNEKCLDIQLEYHSEEQKLRLKMISLAMENGDYDMLNELQARIVPTVYQHCEGFPRPTSFSEYYYEPITEEILKSKDKVLKYFIEEYDVKDRYGNEHKFIYPYLGEIIKRLVKDKSEYAKPALKKAIEHNKRVHTKIRKMLNEAYKIQLAWFKGTFKFDDLIETDTVVKAAMDYYRFDPEEGLVFNILAKAKKDYLHFGSNVIKVEAKSDDLVIQDLIEELNETFNSFKVIQPDTNQK